MSAHKEDAGRTGHTPLPKDGGPAFPTLETETYHPQWGMSLRDYFAARIVGGLVVGCAGMLGDTFSAYAHGYCNQTLANRAYQLADVMLAERAKASP